MVVLNPSYLWWFDVSTRSTGGTNGTKLDRETCHIYGDSHLVPGVLRVLTVLKGDKPILKINYFVSRLKIVRIKLLPVCSSVMLRLLLGGPSYVAYSCTAFIKKL